MGPERRRLNEYIRSVFDKPFAWGEHDCLIFTNTAWSEMHGEGYADDWLGKYMRKGKPVGKKTLQKVYGFNTLDEALDDRLQRVNHVPPYGALVTSSQIERYATGAALGVACGVRACFVGEHGVLYTPIDQIKGAWVCRS